MRDGIETRRPHGIGVSLRPELAGTLIETTRQVDWLEITSENWLGVGGRARRLIDRYAERWTIVPHSVSMSVGGPDSFDDSFFAQMNALCSRLDAPYWSDHVAYARAGEIYTHDLLPLPFSEEALEHILGRVRVARTRANVPLVFENPTYYSRMPGSTLDEGAFLRAFFAESGCGMLLDVNNVYVNAHNHGFDPYAFIDAFPLDVVVQIHVAGHTRTPHAIVDTHVGPVPDAVWDLYRHVIARAGRAIPTLIEWESELPALDIVLDEVDRARVHSARALATREAA